MEPAAGIIVANRFQLVKELGHGGMGSVWLAHHTGLDTACALKFIHQDVAANVEVRARFEREAKAAAQIRSSHVVQILDYGVWENTPYIAMELLEGEDLAGRLKRTPRMHGRDVARIVSQIARALAKAHQAGLVHRDLKPENIFLVTEDDHEIAKVLDFGIAKSHQNILATDSNTKTGSLLGTPHYMSPEQAQGTKAVDHRTDIWALAVVTYRCMTGRLPFDSEALGDLLLKIIVNPVPVPSHVAPDLPATFDQWWLRATNRDVAQRFQSAKEMADALQVALGLSQLPHPLSSQPSGGVPGAASTVPLAPLESGPVVAPTPMGSQVRDPAYSQPGMTSAPVAAGQTPGVGHPITMQAGGTPGALAAPGTFGPGVYGQPPTTKRGSGRLIAGIAGALLIGGIGALALSGGKDGDDVPSNAAETATPEETSALDESDETDATEGDESDETDATEGDDADAVASADVEPTASADVEPTATAAAPPPARAGIAPPPVKKAAPPPPPRPPPRPPPPPKKGGGRDFGF